MIVFIYNIVNTLYIKQVMKNRKINMQYNNKKTMIKNVFKKVLSNE